MTDDGIRRKLLEISNLTRAQASNKAKAAEMSKQNQLAISPGHSGQHNADAEVSPHSNFAFVMKSKQGQSTQHISKASTHFDGSCNYCHKYGHMAKDCFAKKRTDQKVRGSFRQVRGSFPRGPPSGRGGHGRSSQVSGTNYTLWPMSYRKNKRGHNVNAKFDDKTVNFIVDTGAHTTIFSSDFVKELGLPIVPEETPTELLIGDGSLMACQGQVKGRLDLQGKMFNASIKVSDSLPCPALLGDDIISQFSGLDFADNQEAPRLKVFMAQNSDYSALVNKYKDIFDKPIGLAKMRNFDPHPIIELQSGSKPYRDKIRTMSPLHQEVLEEQIPELHKQGVIEESWSEWRHSPVIVPKRNGGYRVAINYKPVNSVTKTFAYPYPRMDDLLAKCAGAKFFSTLDMSQVYHQLELHPDDRPKTAFWACGSLWQYTRCSFGLHNARSYAHKAMNDAFGDLQNVVIYDDDIMPIGATKEEHDEVLEKVFERARIRGLSLNLKKCTLGQTSISYLGHIIENGTVRPDPERLAPLMNLPLPSTVKQLQRFLGMLSYLRNNVPNFAHIAKPLYDMKNYGKISWTDEAKTVVTKIKEAIANSVLALPSQTEKS